MNAQPNPFGGGGFGAPPPVTGMTRLMPHLKTVAAGGFVLTMLLMGAQKVLPDGWRPSDIAGSAAGTAERHEIEEKQAAKIAYDRGVADATAQAQAKAQIDVATVNAVLAQRTAALDAETTFANGADIACLGSQVISAFGTQTTGADWHNGANAVAQATCGAGDRIRQDIAHNQIDAVRTAAADRGSPMTDGAARPTPVHMYSAAELNELARYAAHQPPAVQLSFSANINGADPYWTVYGDRVTAYRAAHPGT